MLNQEFMGFVEQLASIEIEKTPNYKTHAAIAKHPDVQFPDPERVAFSIQIDVTDDFVADPDFEKVIAAYVKTLNRIYARLEKDYPGSAYHIFRSMAKTMTLKYSF